MCCCGASVNDMLAGADRGREEAGASLEGREMLGCWASFCFCEALSTSFSSTSWYSCSTARSCDSYSLDTPPDPVTHTDRPLSGSCDSYSLNTAPVPVTHTHTHTHTHHCQGPVTHTPWTHILFLSHTHTHTQTHTQTHTHHCQGYA